MINMFYNGADSFSPLQEWNQCLASIDIKVIHPQAEKNNCLALHKYDNNITTLKTVGWEEADCTTTWHESHPFKTAMDLMLNFLKTWLTVTTWLTVATWRKTKPVRMIDGSHKSRCLFRRIPLELSLQSIPLKYNCINESIDHFSKRGKLSFCDRNPLKTMIYHSMVQTKNCMILQPF